MSGGFPQKVEVTERFYLYRCGPQERWYVLDKSKRCGDSSKIIADLDRELTEGEAVKFVCYIESAINLAFTAGHCQGKREAVA